MIETSLLLTALTAFLVIFAIILLSYRGGILKVGSHGYSGRDSSVIVAGCSGAGKTAFLSLLKYGRVVETLPSLKSNSAKFEKLNVIDTPGHPKLRQESIQLLRMAKAVLFFVDSSSSVLLTQLTSIAEYLYEILGTIQNLKANGVPVLIVCNKQDEMLVFKKQVISDMLAKEIDKLRSSKSRSIQTLGNEESEEVFLGFEGKPFRFDHLDNEVSFEECSVSKNQVEKVLEWMRSFN